MQRDFVWKNFNLGTELSIAGAFIYNGLKTFNELETFYYEDEIFEFLYAISVGIERLQKIVVILIEHDQNKDQDAFEQSLITHSHIDLLGRIKRKYDLNLGKTHNSFLQLLGNFYKSMRYDRFTLREAYNFDKEKQALKEFLSKELGISFDEDSSFFETPNNDRIKKFIGRVIGKLTSEFYAIVCTEADKQNIFTYEIRVDIKAYKIFLRKEYDFLKETILWKELLIFLMNQESDESIIEFIKKIAPLDFDAGLTKEYLASFQNSVKQLENLDELETLYEEIPKKKERLEMLEILGNTNFVFFDEIDDEEFD